MFDAHICIDDGGMQEHLRGADWLLPRHPKTPHTTILKNDPMEMKKDTKERRLIVGGFEQEHSITRVHTGNHQVEDEIEKSQT